MTEKRGKYASNYDKKRQNMTKEIHSNLIIT